MMRHLLVCGVVSGVAIALLQWSQYRFLVVDHSVEIYGALVAAICSAFGIWLGLKLTSRRRQVEVREVLVPTDAPFVRNEERLGKLGITPREMEILELVAAGLSNREIAERLFVSENTVKTHCSRVFGKLGAERRTQAVQMGKEIGILP
ncbi:winged helix-turn-helix transcriptional regulator [Terriglobus albidus]|uniref:Winged helix-turn-helix transcriptional regulator n=1 Tax=Terriglobus albidus TaxID=1592106 RepID=A0A5B9ECV0_9BACT|nr:LuxR C-terminal-related transcriptional regulator [Terriglobus albidus]QEE29993.1 winged helix-turn-helix transcriptional regulator [Terriglobus albidus]